MDALLDSKSFIFSFFSAIRYYLWIGFAMVYFYGGKKLNRIRA